ncbi:MAG: hypothetical protein IIA83_08215 [Thaumarchaeota archaeon]|nr:hypothetical protein [Nitrososphaerota archaeon]
MKPKYLLDECVSAKKDFYGHIFVQSIDLVGRGALDKEVLDLSKSMKIPIITSDKKFALSVLLENEPVIYKCENKTTMIIPKVIHDQRFSDPVTYHLLKTQSVVRA